MDSVPASSAPSVPSAQDFQGNIERFSGFARDYDHYRPEPPQDLARLLAAYGGFDALSLVIDLGSGTGLSTRYWPTRRSRSSASSLPPTCARRRWRRAARTT